MTRDAITPALRRLLAAAAALLGGIGLAWQSTLHLLAERWQEPQYSHGGIVPALALGVLWSRRTEFPRAALRPHGSGVLVLAAALALQQFGRISGIDPIETASLLPAVVGAVLALGGVPLLRWSATAILLLLFMLPLPFALEAALSLFLQRLATQASAFLLQSLGYAAIPQGMVLVVHGTKLGVEEACSGLRMLTVLMAIGGTVAAASRRPAADRLLILASTVPLAVLVNVIRITVTAIAWHATKDPGVFDRIHDAAGWLMPLAALGLLQLELRIFDALRQAVAFDVPAGPDGAPSPEPDSAANPSTHDPAPLCGTLLAIALTLLFGAGAAQRLWVGPRFDREACEAAAARLSNVPESFAGWSGAAGEIDAASFRSSGATAAVVRHYRHSRHGSVTLILLCGPSGPIAAHPPTVCYQGLGYERIGPQEEWMIPHRQGTPRDGAADQFHLGAFGPRGRNQPAVITAWGWTTDGTWSGPRYPRVAFAGAPVLFKLYLSRPASGQGDDREILRGFAAELTAELRRAVFSPSPLAVRQGARSE